MSLWILILFAPIDPLSDNNVQPLSKIPGFESRLECEEAGAVISQMSKTPAEKIEFICAPMTPERK